MKDARERGSQAGLASAPSGADTHGANPRGGAKPRISSRFPGHPGLLALGHSEKYCLAGSSTTHCPSPIQALQQLRGERDLAASPFSPDEDIKVQSVTWLVSAGRWGQSSSLAPYYSLMLYTASLLFLWSCLSGKWGPCPDQGLNLGAPALEARNLNLLNLTSRKSLPLHRLSKLLEFHTGV